MDMQWENLTSPDFARAVSETGVCILAAGVIEKHSDHLPLGTDFLNGHRLCCLAAEIEPVVVFPPFYFGQIYEAKCFPGTLTLKPTLLMELFFNVLDEIGRNGFKKIIVYNAHGGNIALLRFLAQCSLAEEKPYAVYHYTGEMTPERQQQWNAVLETKVHQHACECETSISLANHPELVKMDKVPTEAFDPLGRLNDLPANFSGISWYANFPEHYAGDARPATREKGLALRQIAIESLAEFIAAVKKDVAVPGLNFEFFERARQIPGSP
jgi:creatinine amidohydrolase